MVRTIGVMALLAALLPAARAESPAVVAKRHYDAGTTAYNLGDFLTAANEYREAYKVKPLPAILYNIAQAYRLGGDRKQAVFFYRSYLRNVPASPDRAECEERIRTLEAEMTANQAAPPKETTEPVTPTPAPKNTQPPSAPPPSTPPAPQVESPARTPALTATAPAADQRRASKKWVWGVVVGAVVVVGVGLGVGLALGLTTDNPAPMGHFGASVF